MPKGGTALVVGGAGFLGRHIVSQLLESRRYASVRVFDIRPCGLPGADERVGDLRKPSDVAAAVDGVDVVIHVATATPTSENSLNKQLMDDVNVRGLQHVIDACRAAGVRRLVYTSSASGAGFGGGQRGNRAGRGAQAAAAAGMKRLVYTSSASGGCLLGGGVRRREGGRLRAAPASGRRVGGGMETDAARRAAGGAAAAARASWRAAFAAGPAQPKP
jgi:nucleoside-diphosphate-sugar epimerase